MLIFCKSVSLNSNNNWLSFINALSKDKRIGDSHMNVPGPDGRYGFGGPCFPKDVKALAYFGPPCFFSGCAFCLPF